MGHIYSKLIFSGLFLLSFIGNIKTQTIEGVIFNESNKPLPGATVSIKPHNLATSANSKGEFRFSRLPSGELELKVTFIGYKP